MSSPTQRSLALLRKSCSLVEVVEKRIPKIFITRDLFGFIDILGINGDLVIAVQTTTGDHVAHRFEKMRYLPAVVHWLSSSSRKLVIHGWRKVGARGTRKLWDCRTVELKLNETGAVEMI